MDELKNSVEATEWATPDQVGCVKVFGQPGCDDRNFLCPWMIERVWIRPDTERVTCLLWDMTIQDGMILH